MTSSVEFTRQSFEEHLRTLSWKQGEHVLMAAPTGAGKSTLMQAIIPKRRHVVILVTKFHDPLFEREFKGWYICRDWKKLPRGEEKVLLWPKKQGSIREDIKHQAQVFSDCLEDIIRKQGWTVVVDELHYTTDPHFLNLGPEIALLHHQGRSAGNTVVNLTQRPAWVPKIVYSSVSHAWIARTRDTQDLRRLSDLGGIDPRTVAAQVGGLPTRHDYLYMNPHGDAPARIVNVRR